MNKKAIFIFFLCFLLLNTIFNLSADQRAENIEIYLVLDKSLSMIEEIESVKEYVTENIINKIVLEGDYFLLVPFYGKTDESFNGYVKSKNDIKTLQNHIIKIEADGHYTDIGNALNFLRKNIITDNELSRKYMLLITDGKQEAPPDSIFYSPDGSFNHDFLVNTKEIQKEGWKIVVLGIGTETAAKEIAEELSAGYTNVSAISTKEEIAITLDNFLGRLDLVSLEHIIKLDKSGIGNLDLEIESTGYTDTEEITINKINMNNVNILNSPLTVSIEKEETIKISIPVNVPLQEEDYTTDLVFVFEGENSFSPAFLNVYIQNSKGIPFYYYIIIIIVISFISYFALRIWQRKKMKNDNNSNESDYEKI
ncbi:MAG: VWA domain-containing protein [Spirochaetia bacterium]|jgi:Mg-chelatase subunit ChlD|nr:VWA domain-containing protein [Spirochaetia bacterium]